MEYISEEGSKPPGASEEPPPRVFCLELEETTGRMDWCNKVLTDSGTALVNFVVLSRHVTLKAKFSDLSGHNPDQRDPMPLAEQTLWR